MTFQLRTCLKCGWEWKSNSNAVRPQCSQCKSTKSVLSEDLPSHIKFKHDFDALKAELSDFKNIYTEFITSYKKEQDRLNKFELQATHDLKDLLFWKNVFRERTDPPKPKKSISSENPEAGLRIVHPKILGPKPSRNIHDWYPKSLKDPREIYI